MPLRLVTQSDTALPAASAQDPVLELLCDGLEVRGAPVLRAFQLILRPGETVLLSGPDVIVRDAVMRCAAGLEAALRGRLRLPEGVGAVLPDPALPRGETPLETVMLCAPVDPVVAFSVLAEVGLQEATDQPLNTLSQVQLRLLALACACAGAPGLLVLNGLFDGLDDEATERVLSVFAAMRAARGIGVLITGLERRTVLPVCNRVVEMTGQPGAIMSETGNWPAPVEVPHTRP